MQGNFCCRRNPVATAGIIDSQPIARCLRARGRCGIVIPCKMRRVTILPKLLLPGVMLLTPVVLAAQQGAADTAWREGRYEAARQGYERVLRQDPQSPGANLRLAILLSWEGKLDSSLVLVSRARSGDPHDADMAVIHARIRSWNKQYSSALALYDSVLARSPGLRDAELGRAQTLAWAGQLGAADSAYARLIRRNTSDRDARLGHAQVSAWQGKLAEALKEYDELLVHNPRDVDALAGSAQVYYWQGKVREARRQTGAALAVDSTHRAARELRHTLDEALRPVLEGTVAWSNDSDHNTSFWQTLGTTVFIGDGFSAFGSVNALETSDPVLEATRVGGEAGLTLALGQVSATAAGGARHLMPEIAPDRTSATYRGRISYRPVSPIGIHLGYSRMPFDETAALIERALDMELLEGGLDARPFRGFSLYASGSKLWLSDGNSRTGVAAGVHQKVDRRLTLGVFGRTLSYERSGAGYFSPDRFSVLEANATYSADTRPWGGSIGGGLGAQQVGEDGDAQVEWHVEGRLGRAWGSGNRVELFGLITNSAVSSTTGAFRYRSAGLNVRLAL